MSQAVEKIWGRANAYIPGKVDGDMTDKEFKRLSRSQLIEVIYQLQLKQDELMADNKKLAQALEDKRLRISEAGNIAQAALEIHNVMQAAQDAAAHYLNEIQLRADEEREEILKNAREQAAAIVAQATEEAAGLLGQGRREVPGPDPVLEAILREYGRKEAGEIDETIK